MIARIASVPISARKLRREKKKAAEVEVVNDPEQVAEDAGLRYVSDDQLGYSRKPRGKKFLYFDTAGKRIKDEPRILRLNRLAIPPAYRDVWICPSPNGHLQATGLDDRGRKQYRYHERTKKWSSSARRCRKFDAGLRAISSDAGFRGRKCWRLWSNFSRRLSSASGMKNTPGRTNRLA